MLGDLIKRNVIEIARFKLRAVENPLPNFEPVTARDGLNIAVRLDAIGFAAALLVIGQRRTNTATDIQNTHIARYPSKGRAAIAV